MMYLLVIIGALEGDEDEDDDDSCSLSQSNSESSLGQFSVRGSADFTAMGINEEALATMLGIKEKDIQPPAPEPSLFHGRPGGKFGVVEVDLVTEEMKLIALRRKEAEERQLHVRGRREYNEYLKRYEQRMIAVATLPDASTSTIVAEQHRHQHQHHLTQGPDHNQNNHVNSTDIGGNVMNVSSNFNSSGGDGGVAPYQGIIHKGLNRHDVTISYLRPQVMVQTGWGGSLLQAYVTRNQSSIATSSFHGASTPAATAAAITDTATPTTATANTKIKPTVTTSATTNIPTTTVTTTTATAVGAEGGVFIRAGEDDSASLSALAASKGSLMPPFSELFYRNDAHSSSSFPDNNGHGLGDGFSGNNGQSPLQPQPPGAAAKKGGRIVSVATARRKFAEASKSVVAERKRQQAYIHDVREAVVVLTPDGHDHGDKGTAAGAGARGQGLDSHYPPSYTHRRRSQGKIVEGDGEEQIQSSIRGTQRGAQLGAQGGAQGGAKGGKLSEAELAEAGFAFAYAEKQWRAKDATSGVLQQVCNTLPIDIFVDTPHSINTLYCY